MAASGRARKRTRSTSTRTPYASVLSRNFVRRIRRPIDGHIVTMPAMPILPGSIRDGARWARYWPDALGRPVGSVRLSPEYRATAFRNSI